MGLPDDGRDRAGRAARGESRASLEALLRFSCGKSAKVAADKLIDRFGSTADVFGASSDAIERVLPDHPDAVEQLGVIRAALEHVLRGQIEARALLGDEAALLDYLNFTMAHRHSEAIRLLFLDIKNRLIRDEILGIGSVGAVALHPREPLRRALELGATAIILVHNHPSGDPTPSRSDIDATRRFATAAALMEIRLHDHLIIARGGWTSLRRMGVLS